MVENQDLKEEERANDLSPERILENYLNAVKIQAEGGKIKGRGIYDNHLIAFGESKRDIGEVFKLLLRNGYIYYDKVEISQGWRIILLEPDGYVTADVGTYSSRVYRYQAERAAFMMFHLGGPEAEERLYKDLWLGDKETGRRLATEASKIIDFLIRDKIPLSFNLSDFEESGIPDGVLKIDFSPRGERKVSTAPLLFSDSPE